MLTIINPATDQVVSEIETDGRDSIAMKFARARRAVRRWAEAPYAEREAAVTRFRDLLVERADKLADILTAEMGKPITQARAELAATPPRIDYFLRHVPSLLRPDPVHQVPESAPIPGTGKMEEVITQEPLGVVANISAWNYPYFVGSNVWIPALLTGCAVVYKPSEHAALTGLAVDELMREAGVPDDVFQTVIGGGEVGAALLEHPFDGVFFTGSYATGRRVAEAAARHLSRVQLELGGKDPAYVCDDADLAVAASVAEGAFYNAGQSCCAIERVYVHEALYDDFVEAFTEIVEAYAVGDPTDKETFIGPVARAAQLEVLEAQVADAVHQGARLLCGGHRLDRPGSYFAPTVLADCTHQMRVMREESFGPIIGLQPVRDDDEAARLMADTDYGLTASVFTPDRARAAAILARLDVGTAYWNCADRVSPRLPWSGRRHSGIGATLSLEGIRAFLRPKAWHLRAP